jgi:hypothetical protein
MQQPRESIPIPPGYLHQRLRFTCLLGSGPERYQVFLLGMPTNNKSSPEA